MNLGTMGHFVSTVLEKAVLAEPQKRSLEKYLFENWERLRVDKFPGFNDGASVDRREDLDAYEFGMTRRWCVAEDCFWYHINVHTGWFRFGDSRFDYVEYVKSELNREPAFRIDDDPGSSPELCQNLRGVEIANLEDCRDCFFCRVRWGKAVCGHPRNELRTDIVTDLPAEKELIRFKGLSRTPAIVPPIWCALVNPKQ